jgi:D-aminoacyl-tRNA deacylase
MRCLRCCWKLLSACAFLKYWLVCCLILLVWSEVDEAGVNIARHVVVQGAFQETGAVFEGSPVYAADVAGKHVTLVRLRGELVYAQDLAECFKGLELVVFLSRHSSVSGTPTLSVHVPGNLGLAELGGLPRTVSVAPACAMHAALKTMMQRASGLAYEVSYECTHHGPSLSVPALFVELGSSVQNWRDQAAARVVADAALAAVKAFGASGGKAVVGVGGPHYNMKFTRLALADKAVFGHIIPKYAVNRVDETLLRHCVERTVEPVSHVVLDWKGIRGEDKPGLVSVIGALGLTYEKV